VAPDVAVVRLLIAVDGKRKGQPEQGRGEG
jgi:hypothetical protein